ncbi:MAG: hypothetical protein IKX00_00510 [Bacilli bacterium]|nr:hypothetical protein [Bacilli bacterium]
MKLLHYINGNLSDTTSKIDIEEEKNLKKYKFFLDNIINYIYITDRLVFIRESDDYIFELNISDNVSCKLYLKSENKEFKIDVKKSIYSQNDKYIDFSYILETNDEEEHHIILKIGD